MRSRPTLITKDNTNLWAKLIHKVPIVQSFGVKIVFQQIKNNLRIDSLTKISIGMLLMMKRMMKTLISTISLILRLLKWSKMMKMLRKEEAVPAHHIQASPDKSFLTSKIESDKVPIDLPTGLWLFFA